jgi:DNA-binding response OmpR family regulator
LDLVLPKIDGWEIFGQLRARSNVPIIILSAKGEENERIKGLSLGADDYVVKPFSPRELLERVRAVLRRARPALLEIKKPLVHRELLLEPEKQRVTLEGRNLKLTHSEYTLLHVLMSFPGRVLSREELLRYLYPRGETVINRIIDVHVGKLRQKLGDDPSKPRFIFTVKGSGYRFTDKAND